jgi:uncharacterized protein (UPF0276 family)
MNCRWFSEHLSFTQYRDVDTGQLQPVQFSEWNLRFLARKIRKMSRIFGRPVLIENSAYYYTIPGSTLGEAEFIARLLAEAQCGLLLDVNNLYANALNHNYDPHRFIDCMPTHAVVEIHVAGGEMRGGVYIDTHGHPVNDNVLELLEYAVTTKRPNGVVLEREKNFPPIGQILEEVRTLKEIWYRADRRLPVVA